MPTYITLFRYTPAGLRSIKETPRRRQANQAALAAIGLQLRGLYLTLGQYDQIAVYDAPDDDAVARAALIIGGQGTLSTETMRAFTAEETDRLIESLP
jgi:uncharacterized protein with GYD domain